MYLRDAETEGDRVRGAYREKKRERQTGVERCSEKRKKEKERQAGGFEPVWPSGKALDW